MSDDLFIQALDLDYRMKIDPNRIGPMGDNQLSNLGLLDAQKGLSSLSDREVDFMLIEL